MSRLHGRSPCDWTLTTERDPGFFTAWGLVPVPDRYLLSLRLTHEQAHALLESVSARPGSPGWAYRGCPDFSSSSRAGDHLVDVRNIEVTAAEADQVARGASPLDILFAWPELGYRLVAVEHDWSMP